MEDVVQKNEQWEWFMERITRHLQELKDKFANDPKMTDLLKVYDKILDGSFEFTWKKGENRVIIEDVIELNVDDNAIPQREPLQYYLISTYPGPVYTLFLERVKKFLQNSGGVIPAKDFELLRQTLNNLEFLATNQMPHSVEIEGKHGKIIFKLPLEVEVEDKSSGALPADLWEASMLIAGHLDEVFNKIKETIRES